MFCCDNSMTGRRIEAVQNYNSVMINDQGSEVFNKISVKTRDKVRNGMILTNE